MLLFGFFLLLLWNFPPFPSTYVDNLENMWQKQGGEDQVKLKKLIQK